MRDLTARIRSPPSLKHLSSALWGDALLSLKMCFTRRVRCTTVPGCTFRIPMTPSSPLRAADKSPALLSAHAVKELLCVVVCCCVLLCVVVCFCVLLWMCVVVVVVVVSETAVSCTVWHCANLSLRHNCNVQHSDDELCLRHDDELEGLLEHEVLDPRDAHNHHGQHRHHHGPVRKPTEAAIRPCRAGTRLWRPTTSSTAAEPGPTGSPTTTYGTPRTRRRQRRNAASLTAPEPPAWMSSRAWTPPPP